MEWVVFWQIFILMLWAALCVAIAVTLSREEGKK